MPSHNRITKSASYLIRTPYSYCFRMIVPTDLRPYVRKKELRRTLRTGYLAEAKEKARFLAFRIHRLFRWLRQRKGITTLGMLTQEEIHRIVDQYITDAYRDLEERWFDDTDDPEGFFAKENLYAFGNDPTSHSTRLQDVRAMQEDIRIDLASGNYSAVQDQVDMYLEQDGLSGIGKDSIDYRRIGRAFAEAYLKTLEVEYEQVKDGYMTTKLESLLHNPPTPPPAAQPPVPQGPPVPDGGSITLAELIDKFVRDKTRGKRGEKEWKPATRKEYDQVFRILNMCIDPSTPVRTLTKSMVRDEFRDVLVELPKYFLSAAKYKNKSIKEVLAMRSSYDTNSKTRINNQIGFAGALFNWAVQEDHMTHNIFSGLKLSNKKGKVHQERFPFNKDDLNALFYSDQYIKDTHAEPHHFWLPILALYTGCRITELSQLYVSELKKVQGIWYLDINEKIETPFYDENGNEDETEKSIKTGDGERYIPLHDIVANKLNFVGFINYVKSFGYERMFPEIKKYTSYLWGHKPSNWFGDYRVACGITSEKKVFHSFRHTFTNELKQKGVSDTMINELTGHVVEGESMGRYSDPYEVPPRYKNGIMKLNYKVDLNHLAKSKYCTLRQLKIVSYR